MRDSVVDWTNPRLRLGGVSRRLQVRPVGIVVCNEGLAHARQMRLARDQPPIQVLGASRANDAPMPSSPSVDSLAPVGAPTHGSPYQSEGDQPHAVRSSAWRPIVDASEATLPVSPGSRARGARGLRQRSTRWRSLSMWTMPNDTQFSSPSSYVKLSFTTPRRFLPGATTGCYGRLAASIL